MFGIVTGIKSEGLVIDIKSGQLKATFNGDGKGFQNPHDIAVSADGNVAYVVEINPFKVWKLTNGEDNTCCMRLKAGCAVSKRVNV